MAAALIGVLVWVGAVLYFVTYRSASTYSQLSERGFCDAREVPGSRTTKVEEVYFVGCGGFF